MYSWQRSSRTVLTGALGLALLVGLNTLAIKWSWRWDTTVNKRYSLAQEAITVLRNLNNTVSATAFYLPDDSREATEDLFQLITGETKQFTYEFIDPDKRPLLAKQEQITQRGSVVVTSGERKETVIFPDQEKLINAIIRVSTTKQAKVLLVTGHGELDPDAAPSTTTDTCSQFKKNLTDQGTQVEKTVLATLPAIPQDTNAVLLLGPKKDLLDRELKLLSDYLDIGGRLLVALAAEEYTNLDSWLGFRLGLARQAGLMVDPVSKLISGDPLTPLVQTYAKSSVTRNFNLMTLYPTCVSLTPLNPVSATQDRSGSPHTDPLKPLCLSTEQSWLETDLAALHAGTAAFDAAIDFPSPLWLSAIYEAPAKVTKQVMDTEQTQAGATQARQCTTRVVVFGDQDFLADKYVRLVGNLDLARNSINWLLEREELITVSKPKPTNALLLLSPLERQLINLVPFIFIPGITLTLAIIMYKKRRKAR